MKTLDRTETGTSEVNWQDLILPPAKPKTKYLAVVSENGYKDVKKIIERMQAKYGKDATVEHVLKEMNKEVLVLN